MVVGVFSVVFYVDIFMRIVEFVGLVFVNI